MLPIAPRSALPVHALQHQAAGVGRLMQTPMRTHPLMIMMTTSTQTLATSLLTSPMLISRRALALLLALLLHSAAAVLCSSRLMAASALAEVTVTTIALHLARLALAPPPRQGAAGRVERPKRIKAPTMATTASATSLQLVSRKPLIWMRECQDRHRKARRPALRGAACFSKAMTCCSRAPQPMTPQIALLSAHPGPGLSHQPVDGGRARLLRRTTMMRIAALARKSRSTQPTHLRLRRQVSSWLGRALLARVLALGGASFLMRTAHSQALLTVLQVMVAIAQLSAPLALVQQLNPRAADRTRQLMLTMTMTAGATMAPEQAMALLLSIWMMARRRWHTGPRRGLQPPKLAIVVASASSCRSTMTRAMTELAGATRAQTRAIDRHSAHLAHEQVHSRAGDAQPTAKMFWKRRQSTWIVLRRLPLRQALRRCRPSHRLPAALLPEQLVLAAQPLAAACFWTRSSVSSMLWATPWRRMILASAPPSELPVRARCRVCPHDSRAPPSLTRLATLWRIPLTMGRRQTGRCRPLQAVLASCLAGVCCLMMAWVHWATSRLLVAMRMTMARVQRSEVLLPVLVAVAAQLSALPLIIAPRSFRYHQRMDWVLGSAIRTWTWTMSLQPLALLLALPASRAHTAACRIDAPLQQRASWRARLKSRGSPLSMQTSTWTSSRARMTMQSVLRAFLARTMLHCVDSAPCRSRAAQLALLELLVACGWTAELCFRPARVAPLQLLVALRVKIAEWLSAPARSEALPLLLRLASAAA